MCCVQVSHVSIPLPSLRDAAGQLERLQKLKGVDDIICDSCRFVSDTRSSGVGVDITAIGP